MVFAWKQTLSSLRIVDKSLNQGLSFKEIAKYLCKDPSTISKEVKKH
ncbi:MAG: helix-turn-helix domain-containing protein, partial [Segatella salivae]